MANKLTSGRKEEIQDFLLWVQSMYHLKGNGEVKRSLENSYGIMPEKEIAERMQTALDDFGITKQELYQYFGKKEYIHKLSKKAETIIRDASEKAGIYFNPEEDIKDSNKMAAYQWQMLEHFKII